MKKGTFVTLLAAFSAALIGLDQLLKWLADTRLKGAGTVRIIGDFVVLVYARNPGAFLSIGDKLVQPWRTILLVILPVIVLGAFVAIFLRKKRLGGRDLALLSLLLGGGLGNILDRIFHGEVTDYLLFQLTPRIRTGVMNAADLYILAVVIIIVLETFKKPETEKAGAEEKAKRP